jgi:starch-binding outer membrane protein, SusD/RagB family
MLIKYKKQILFPALGFILLAVTFSSCDNFVDAGSPDYQLTEDKIFTDSATALSSVLSLYTYYTKNYIKNLNQYGAMSADDGYYFNNANYDIYRTNTLTGGVNYSNVVYNNPYQIIYIANYNIEALSSTANLSNNLKTQLLGECKFWRAYCYFNLVNYFGAVPLVVSTDALSNSKLPRSDVSTVYEQIVADLLDAESKLQTTYSTYEITEKARVNKYVVNALLARVYLYQEQWAAAEAEADTVINSTDYSLETDLNDVFIKTSNEVIWQDAVPYNSTATGVTQMGVSWIPSGTSPLFVLYDTLANTFTASDLRKANWIKPIVYAGKTYYYPYKYKIRITSAAGNEYNVMFRLAEQYLIRAEARAQQNKITGVGSAEEDLNTIRNRAGLENTEATDKSSILLAIEKERWLELFTEMGDRWFNLKRTGRADAVFSAETEKKSTWQSYQALYPIPQAELTANPNLLPDNPGY